MEHRTNFMKILFLENIKKPQKYGMRSFKQNKKSRKNDNEQEQII